MKELGIQSIVALSPQAKGRVERLWGALQDRLVAELRLAGASTVAEANRVLEAFLLCFNAHFGVSAAQPGSAYRSLPPGLEMEGVLCFKYVRTVAKDNTVRFGGHTLQLLPGLDRPSYARARVEVQERLDGSLVVAYQGRVLATTEAPPHPAVLRARKGTQSQPPAHSSLMVGACPHHEEARRQAGNKGNGHKPSLDHPWRRYPVVTKSLTR